MEKYSTRGTLVGLFILMLNLYDVLSTRTLIKYCGGDEGSPIVSKILEWGGFTFLLIIKIVLCLAIIFMFSRYWTRFKIARIGGYIVLAVYSVLTIYHMINLLLC